MKKILLAAAVMMCGMTGCGRMKNVRRVGDLWIAPNGVLCAQYFSSDHSAWTANGGHSRGLSYWASEGEAVNYIESKCEVAK